MSTDDLKNLLNKATIIFLEKEKENIINDIAERNLCARLDKRFGLFIN